MYLLNTSWILKTRLRSNYYLSNKNLNKMFNIKDIGIIGTFLSLKLVLFNWGLQNIKYTNFNEIHGHKKMIYYIIINIECNTYTMYFCTYLHIKHLFFYFYENVFHVYTDYSRLTLYGHVGICVNREMWE